MAQVVLTNGHVTINAVDYSDQMKSGSLTYAAAEVDDTAMGDTTESATGGLFNWSGEIDFIQDEASGQTGANLFAIVGTVVTIIMRPDAGAVSATNPNYTGSALITSYTPLSGAVGELNMARLSFRSAGALSRATS